jgi:hypothetical protein
MSEGEIFGDEELLEIVLIELTQVANSSAHRASERLWLGGVPYQQT